MASLFINLDRTQANYEQWFTYTIGASFNSLTTSTSLVQIVCFLPDIVDYDAHTANYPIESISYESTSVGGISGTNIIFTLVPLTGSGLSLSFEIMARFKLPTDYGASVVMEVTVYQTNLSPQTFYATPVTLIAVAHWTVDQNLILPLDVGVMAGSYFYYDIILQNIGDKGALTTNFELVEVLPSGVTLDTTYPIEGIDISDYQFIDTSANQILTPTTSDTFTLNLSAYKGTRYRIRFRGQANSDLQPGDTLTLTLNYAYTTLTTIGPITLPTILHIEEPTLSGNIAIYGPNHTRSDSLISYEGEISNTGNTDLFNVEFHTSITPNLNVASFSTGSMWISATEELIDMTYTMSFSTLNGTVIPPLTLNMNRSQTFNFGDFNLPAGEKILIVTYTLPTLPLGATMKDPIVMNGTVATTSSLTSRIYTSSTLLWDTLTAGEQASINNNFSTGIDNISELYMTAQELSPNRSVRPKDTITYKAIINCLYSPLHNPVFVMILNSHIDYDNYISYEYTDYFGSNIEDIPTPPPIIIPNYAGGPNTVLLISYSKAYSGNYSYTFNQRATIGITLRFKVKIGAIGTIRQSMLLASQDGAIVVSQGMDTLNVVQPDGNVLVMLQTNSITNLIERYLSLLSDFKVKGSLDADYTEYPEVGKSYEGDLINYQIELLNDGNVDIQSIEIVNIIPHIGDTGVILTNQPRGSEFTIYQATGIQYNLIPSILGDPSPNFSIFYSTSYNPIRFGANFISNNIVETIGDPLSTWTSIIPADTTSIGSYKVVSTNTTIHPGQTLKIHALFMIPFGVPSGLTAWNSFAAKVTYLDLYGNPTTLLPIEPEMAGVMTQSLDPTRTKIGGFVWIDENKDGLYTLNDPGVNDTIVMIYDEQGHYLSTVTTAPSSTGQSGYYLFNNLSPGKYYLRFVPDTRIYNLTMQVLDNPNGSLPSPTTGFTPLIDMTTSSENMYIIAGVIAVTRLENILAMNKAANKTLRSVLYSQILLDLKLEDTKQLIDEFNK